jgi:hypothetical protein
MMIGPQGGMFPSMLQGPPAPEAPRDTETAQVSWGDPPASPAAGIAQVNWSNQKPEAIADGIIAHQNAKRTPDGQLDYRVPVGNSLQGRNDADLEDRTLGSLEAYGGTGESIRRQLRFLNDIQSGSRTVSDGAAPTNVATGLAQNEHADATKPRVDEDYMRSISEPSRVADAPAPRVNATPVSTKTPQPVESEAADSTVPEPDRPKDPKAAILPVSQPVMTPKSEGQIFQEARATRRSMYRNASRKPHLDAAAREMGIDSVPFHQLTGKQITELRAKANDLQHDHASQQINDRQSDRNQSREQNIPIGLATANRLQGRGNAILAQAEGLHDSDPNKAVMMAQGQRMLDHGNQTHQQFMEGWRRQQEANTQQQVFQAARMYGRHGAAIVQQYMQGQTELAERQLSNASAERVANTNAASHTAGYRINADATVKAAQIGADATRDVNGQRTQERQQDKADTLAAQEADRKLREKLAKEAEDGHNNRHTETIKAGEARTAADLKQNPPPTPPEQRENLILSPMQGEFSNRNSGKPIQTILEETRQQVMRHEPDPTARKAYEQRANAAAANHAMSRFEMGDHRPHDKQYITSLMMRTDPDTGMKTLLDKNSFMSSMMGQYSGSNWEALAPRLSALYDEMQAKTTQWGEKPGTNSTGATQIGMPDNPMV